MPKGMSSAGVCGVCKSKCIIKLATMEKATLCTILYPMQDLLPMEKGWKCAGFLNSPELLSRNLCGLYASGSDHNSGDMFKQ